MVVAGVGEEGAGPEKVQLCQDLIETTLDMLARYTYSNISSLPSRCDSACYVKTGPCSTACATIQILWGRVPCVWRTQ